MGRMQVLYSFNLVDMEIRDFHIWLSRFYIAASVMALRHEISGELWLVWVDKRAKIDKFFHYRNLLPLDCDCWWLVLPAAQSLDFCLLPVHLKLQRYGLCCHRLKCRYENSSSLARRATSLAESRSEKACRPNDAPFMAEPTVLSSSQSSLWRKSLVPTHTLVELQIQLWTRHFQAGMHEHS